MKQRRRTQGEFLHGALGHVVNCITLRVTLPGLALVCTLGAGSPPDTVPRDHSLTVVAPNDGAAAYNATFGAGNWTALAPYVDLLVAPRTAQVPATMKTARYLDVNLCSNLTGPGKNDYPFPDCSAWPEGAFYAQPGHPERPLSTKSGGIWQRFGAPSSPQMRALALAAIDGALHAHDDTLIYLDDATPPDDFYADMCWGAPSFEKGTGPCEGAPGGRARPPVDGGAAAWVAGMRQLIDAVPRPVLLNGGLASDAAHVPSPETRLIATDAHVWGAACDGCFYGNSPVPKNKYLWSGPVLRTRLDGIMHVTGAGKNVVLVDFAVTDPAARRRALADVMLFYEADRTWFWYAACGERSHIQVCPEAALTFYRPLRPYPKDVRDVAAAGGAFVREFAACYDAGKPVGPCATVVNPEPERSVPLPELHGTYAHSLRISGDGLCACYGDTGSLDFDGPAAPATLPAASGFVLFR